MNIRDWMCGVLCRDRLFNSSMSIEIDRLTVESEKHNERIAVLEAENARLRKELEA
jgi:hypothetical protein